MTNLVIGDQLRNFRHHQRLLVDHQMYHNCHREDNSCKKLSQSKIWLKTLLGKKYKRAPQHVKSNSFSLRKALLRKTPSSNNKTSIILSIKALISKRATFHIQNFSSCLLLNLTEAQTEVMTGAQSFQKRQRKDKRQPQIDITPKSLLHHQLDRLIKILKLVVTTCKQKR